MVVRIIQYSDHHVWYNEHIGEYIEIDTDYSDEKFPKDEIFQVIGPKKLLKYYEENKGFIHLGVDKCDTNYIQLERITKLKRILK